jgi:hypothetical protein
VGVFQGKLTAALCNARPWRQNRIRNDSDPEYHTFDGPLRFSRTRLASKQNPGKGFFSPFAAICLLVERHDTRQVETFITRNAQYMGVRKATAGFCIPDPLPVAESSRAAKHKDPDPHDLCRPQFVTLCDHHAALTAQSSKSGAAGTPAVQHSHHNGCYPDEFAYCCYRRHAQQSACRRAASTDPGFMLDHAALHTAPSRRKAVDRRRQEPSE